MRSIGSGSEVEGSGDGFPGVVWRDGWGRLIGLNRIGMRSDRRSRFCVRSLMS